MCFSDNKKHLITCSSLGVIYIWKLPESIQKILQSDHLSKVISPALSVLEKIKEEEFEDSIG